MSQIPSVGRIVHFYSEAGVGKLQPHPAIITHVHDDGRVNLLVFSDADHPIRGENIVRRVAQPTATCDSNSDPFWMWPPSVPPVRDIPLPATTEVPPPAPTEPLGTSDGPAAGPNVRAPANN